MGVSPFENGLHSVEVRQRAGFRESAEGGGVFDGFSVRPASSFSFCLYICSSNRSVSTILQRRCRQRALTIGHEPHRDPYFWGDNQGRCGALYISTHQIHFDQTDRLELFNIRFELEIVSVVVFIGQDYCTGIESVFEGVHGRDLAAFGGDRSVGFGAVVARGIDFSFRRHRLLCCPIVGPTSERRAGVILEGVWNQGDVGLEVT